MNLLARGGANLKGSSQERSSVLPQSLRSDVFGGHVFVEEDVAWN